MVIRVVLVVLAVAKISEAAVKLGDLVTPCSLKAPNLNDCLTTQGRRLIPHFVAGVKDWGILSMDPLFVPLLELQRSDGGPISLSIKVKNSTQYGWKEMELQSIKLDRKTYTFNVKWKFPRYVMLGLGETSGRIILLPITGIGASNTTFLNVDVDMTMKSLPEVRGSKTYLKVTDVKCIINVEKLVLKLDNIFSDNLLSDSMNKIINDNSKEIFEELKPNVQDIFSGVLSTILSRFFSKVPLEELFKDFGN